MGWVTARQFFLKDLSITASVVPDRKVVVTRLKDSCDTLFLTAFIRSVLFDGDRQTMLLDEFFKSVDLNTDITSSTKKTIYSIFNQVVGFLKVEKSAKHFFIDQLDEAFIEEYQWYCVNEKKLSNATIHSHFRKVRSFVNWAKRRGYTEHNFPRFKISIGENDIVFLQRDEILKLFQFDEFDPI